MKEIKSYKDLLIWQRSKQFAIDIYKLTSTFPKEEVFSLTSQMRRSSVSVPSNIAEGWGRDSRLSFIYFLNIAKTSLFELETQLIISKDLNYTNETIFNKLIIEMNEISKMIVAFINTLKKKST